MPLFVIVIQYNKSCQNCSLCLLETNLLKFCSMSQITQHQIPQLLFHSALGSIPTGFCAIFARVRAESFSFEHETFLEINSHRNPIYKAHWVTGMVLLASFISEMPSLFPTDYCKIQTNYILDEIPSRSMRSPPGLNTAWPFAYRAQKHCILTPTAPSEMLGCSTKNKDYRSRPSWEELWWRNSLLLPCPETLQDHTVSFWQQTK